MPLRFTLGPLSVEMCRAPAKQDVVNYLEKEEIEQWRQWDARAVIWRAMSGTGEVNWWNNRTSNRNSGFFGEGEAWEEYASRLKRLDADLSSVV